MTAPTKRRLYIGKKYEDGDHYEEDIWDFLSDRVLPVPNATFCEYDEGLGCMGVPPNLATTFVYVIKDGHVCYTYVCEPCAEVLVDNMSGVEPGEYPTTQDGYASVPRHCS